MTSSDAARDTGYAPERWTFDDEITRVFDNMLSRSIPQLDIMRGLVTDVAATFVRPLSTILDLGCSRGESLSPLLERFGTANNYVGIEISGPMLDACRDRFSKEIASGLVRIEPLDLRHGFPDVRTSVTLSVLTMIFIPVNHRQRILNDVYRSLVPGGAFILVEKLLGNGARIERMMVDRYHRFKGEQGYTQEEIERKRLALEGVQVPLTTTMNEGLLYSAGFSHVETFWRWMNFSGVVAVKEVG